MIRFAMSNILALLIAFVLVFECYNYKRMNSIESPKNKKIKELFRLHERRIRNREQRYLLEGTRELERALEAKAEIVEILYAPKYLSPASQKLIANLLKENNFKFSELSKEAFKKLSLRQNPDGVLSVLKMLEKNIEDLDLPNDALVVVLDSLEKPGNLGAILRTADSADVNAIFITGKGTDIYNPNVLRSSLGSFYSKPVISLDSAKLIDYLKEHSFNIVATSPAVNNNYWRQNYKARTAIVLGSEDKGLGQDWLDAANIKVSIPMLGLADSLNVSTAAALLIYEALRQRYKG